jgi:hypothetical protein
MKTEQLLEALVADQASRRQPIARSLFRAMALGAGLSLLFFAVELGVRVDIGPALETWRFDLKIVTVLLALVLATGLCLDCLRPDASPHPLRRLLPLLAVVLTAIAVELLAVPLSGWKARLIGTNWLICLSMVPILSFAPLAAILAVLRRGAPASPTLAGAAAGFLAAACGATLYAFHCFDDSPLFVATWYLLAAIPVVVIGAVAGSRLLRW